LIRKLTSKKGISPILATLLLIAIAVAAAIISYAWIITFVSTQTQQSGAVLVRENIRFYNVSSTNKTDITLRNTGSSSAKIAAVYWSGSSSSALAKIGTNEYTMTPSTGVVNALDSITITITWGVSGGVISESAWTPGKTYYFKVVTQAGPYLEFPAKAP